MLRKLTQFTGATSYTKHPRRPGIGRSRAARIPKLALETLEPRQMLNAEGLVINEFMASNERGLEDWDLDDSDWIEIYNPTAATVSLDRSPIFLAN